MGFSLLILLPTFALLGLVITLEILSYFLERLSVDRKPSSAMCEAHGSMRMTNKFLHVECFHYIKQNKRQNAVVLFGWTYIASVYIK